jgi:hypothetical protein
MNKVMITALICALFTVGCSDPNQEKIDELKKECISIHDEVMPRLDEIVSLNSEIKAWRNTLEKDTTDSASMAKRMLVMQINMLDSAYESMMLWMGEYDPTYEVTNSSDSALVYYDREKESIKKVKDLMKKSIDDGKKVLELR